MYTYNQENQEPVGLTDPGLRKITWIVSSDVEWLEPCNLGGQADPGGGRGTGVDSGKIQHFRYDLRA